VLPCGSDRPDRGWLLMHAAACAEMPWLVMTTAAHCGKTAARECFRPLVPLLRRALEHMEWRFQAVPLGKKVWSALSNAKTLSNNRILGTV
jgi:hypothetical protein